ncbi:MAG: preprotein translocase subunit SecE [Chitinophagaceae bacterium]|nr:preprotein translocase subunit SecE [Chitinophagaceae bacterium]
MNKVISYVRESYKEMIHKVTWPNWDELQQSTMIVLISTILITALIYLMDTVSNSVMGFIYSLFK